MKKQLTILGIVILLLIVGFSGCFENQRESFKELSVEQIKTNFVNAVKNVNSYKCISNNSIIKSVYNGSKINTTETQGFSNYSVDISNNMLKDEGEYTTVGTSEKYQIKIYLLDDLQYTGTGAEGNLSWEKKNYSNSHPFAEENWMLFSPLEFVTEEMKAKNVTWERLGDEILDGTPYYVLQNISTTNNSNATHSGYDFSEWQQRYWIDKTNYSLHKYMRTQILDDTGYYFIGKEGDRRYLINEIEVTFYDYNIPVTIELPQEALQKI